MVWGGIRQEHLLFSEDSLWKGWPETGNRAGAADSLPEIRRLLRENKIAEAQPLIKERLLGIGGEGTASYGRYQPFCDVLLTFTNVPARVENYRRELNLERGVAAVSYTADGAEYRREYFCSHPDQVLAMRLTSSRRGGLNFDATLRSEHRQSTVTADGNVLILAGRLGNEDPAHPGMTFEGRLLIHPEGGALRAGTDSITVAGADAVTILLAGATDYRLAYPTYTGRDPVAENKRSLATAAAKSYAELLEAHLRDYQSLSERVELKFGYRGRSQLPTDERLAAYAANPDDRPFEALLFQYGRYLLISSSRPGGLPANLQGLWNKHVRPPWNCNYTGNINVEMNYWPALPCNLAECGVPYIDWIEDLAKAGATTAKAHGNARGWIANHNLNVWGHTAPGRAGGQCWFPTGAGWLSQYVWEHYAFTGDKRYLREKAWPIMKGAAELLARNRSGHAWRRLRPGDRVGLVQQLPPGRRRVGHGGGVLSETENDA
jgi:alpha-L-fucosidase 2